MAITQPVLDVFGNTPEQLVYRGVVSTADLVVFAAVVALAPALLLTLPGVIARSVSERAGAVVHLVAVGSAVYVALLQVLHGLGIAGIAKAVVALVGAGATTIAFSRFESVRSWAKLLAMSSPVFVAMFLFASPSGDLAFAATPDLIELEPEAEPSAPVSEEPVERFPDIVMIVLDELPTSILLDRVGNIDEVRYPHVAEFADTATWYRSYTTVNAATLHAVPALLSGQLPDGPPSGVWTEHPDTLFRLLGGTYHLTVSEGVTKLCPDAWCGSTPIPPPMATPEPAEPVPTDTTPPPTTTAPPVPQVDRGGLSSLLGDGVDVWRSQIALDPDETPVFTGLSEIITAAPTTTSTTTTLPSTSGDEDLATLDSLVPSGDDEPHFQFPNDAAGQSPRAEEFRSTFRPSDDPTFYFLHLVLPHSPYEFTEAGTRYSSPTDPSIDGAGSEWDSAIVAERVSLQMRFADRLLGQMFDSLRDTGIYDDALVVVVSDHGAGLPGNYGGTMPTRYYDGTNASELMVTPLLVKMPRQDSGVISDASVEAVDLVPTIADLLDIDVPWPVDGTSILGAGSDAPADECDPRQYVRIGRSIFGDEEDKVEQFVLCANDLVPVALRPVLGELDAADEWATAGLARLTPYAELLGTTWGGLDAQPGTSTVLLADRRGLQEGTSPPSAVVRGTVFGPDSPRWIAIAVDGRIVGISPVHDRQTAEKVEQLDLDIDRSAIDQFTFIIPSPLLSESGYEIRIAALATVDGGVVATELMAAN